MKNRSSLLLVLSILCSFTPVQSQTTPVDKNRKVALRQEQLKKLMSKVGVDVLDLSPGIDHPQAYRELKLRLGDPAKSATELKPAINSEERTQAPSVSIVEDKKRSGTLPRHRSLELSPAHIFIVAVDAKNKLRWWSIMSDPRVVRAETQTSQGETHGETYYVSNVTFMVAFPDDPQITNLRFYHPVWNGTDFDLKPLAVVPIR